MNLASVRMKGFTLLEILIALFVFSILSLIMAGGLRSVINAQTGTEENAERLRNLQFVLLMMSRDVEQALNRPVVLTTGREEPAFIGSPTSFTFTHSGFANPNAAAAHSVFQRTRYEWQNSAIWRTTWPVLDQAPQTKPHARQLLEAVSDAHFEYLDQTGRFQSRWPVEGESKQPLPKAVRINMTITNWGTISQLYVIPAQASKAEQPAPKS